MTSVADERMQELRDSAKRLFKDNIKMRDKIKNIFKWCDGKFRLIKKLEKRIHKQRLALRERWEIVRMHQAYRKTPLRSMWFDKAIVLSKEKHEVEARLKTCLAVREDELHYAKQDAVSSIRAVYEK